MGCVYQPAAGWTAPLLGGPNPGHGPPAWCSLGGVSMGLVWACGNSTTRCRVRGGRSASAGRSLCLRESVVVAGAGSTGGEICGGATGASSRAAAPPGPVAVLLPQAQPAGCGFRPVDPVGPWSTAVRANQPTSARHAGRSARSQLGDIRRHPRDARPQAPRGSYKGVQSRDRESWVLEARTRCFLLWRGRCFVLPAASASRRPSRPLTQPATTGRGRATPGKYVLRLVSASVGTI